MLLCIGVLSVSVLWAIEPNPIISRGPSAVVKVSSGDSSAINNNKWGPYEKKQWAVSANSWIAIKVVDGTYSNVFISWNCIDTSWSDMIGVNKDSCNKTVQYPTEYDIMTSANSTTGSDGDWTKVVSITGNNVCARGHFVPFTGMKWIKMSISKGTGKIDEVEVFDGSKGMQDSWFFLGTKITAMMMKDSLASGFHPGLASMSDSNFANMVHMLNNKYTPAVIRGGNNCGVKSGDIVRDISKYLEVAGNVTFWAIEIGTWDAWGGKKDSLAAFINNVQLIIDSCKAHKIKPTFARVMPTDTLRKKTLWQVPIGFTKAIDSLTTKNGLIPGVDFPAYIFHAQMGNYDLDEKTGILPNTYGDFEFQKEWVKKMDTVVYKAKVFANQTQPTYYTTDKFSATYKNDRLDINADCAGAVSIFTIQGELVDKIVLTRAGSYTRKNAPGLYMVKFTNEKGLVQTIPLLNR